MHSSLRRTRGWRRRAVLALAPALVSALAAAPAAGQRLPAPRFDGVTPHYHRAASYPIPRVAADSPTVSLKAAQSPTGLLIVGAVVGGALAGGAGAGLGAAGGNPPNSDGVGEAIAVAVGAILLEPIGMGIGTNIANRGRGSAPLDVLAAAGTLLGVAFSLHSAGIYVVIPAQVAATVAVERATARRARPAPPAAAPITPQDTAGAAALVPGAGAAPGWR